MTERISIVTDEISLDLNEVRSFLRDHRLPAIELRCVGEKRVPDIERDDYEIIRMMSWNREAKIVAVSPGLFKCSLDDEEEVRRHIEVLVPWSAQMAVELGADHIVAFTFDNPKSEQIDGRLVDLIGQAAEACAEADVPLLLENEPGQFGGRPGEMLAVLDAVDHENLFVNWDPTNGNEFGEDELRAGLTALFPRVRHVHVKNGVLDDGEIFARCGPLREGAIDWPTHLRLLKELGYRGYLGIETHYQPVREGSETVLGELREMTSEIGFFEES